MMNSKCTAECLAKAIRQKWTNRYRSIDVEEWWHIHAAQWVSKRAINECQIKSSLPSSKGLLGVVCHERLRSKRRRATLREMRDGPSRSAVRCRPQTAASGCC